MPWITVSGVATTLTFVYIFFMGFNFYKLMNPLYGLDLSEFPATSLINPLWLSGTEDHFQIKVYLSHRNKFSIEFLEADALADGLKGRGKYPSAVLLWDEMITVKHDEVEPPLEVTKSFVLTKGEEKDEGLNKSVAMTWFDVKETDSFIDKSILITGFQSIRQKLGYGDVASKEADDSKHDYSKVIEVDESSPIWSALMKNNTVHIHSIIIRHSESSKKEEETRAKNTTLTTRSQKFSTLARSHNVLLGAVPMVKHDTVLPVKPTRILYHDILYVVDKYILGRGAGPAPWDLAITQPDQYFNYQLALQHKKTKTMHPFWKPEVSIRMVPEQDSYPDQLLSNSFPVVRLPKPTPQHPSGYSYLPPLHVDEIGLTSEKYIPLNDTVSALPLRITFDSHSLSGQRWRLLQHFSANLENQKELGFDNEDIDEIRRLIAETDVVLLGVTVLASVLHLLFEFLTFKSDVQFWQKNKDITGLSIRALFVDAMSQFVILLFLMDKGSSLLVTVPCAVGVMIAVWKCQRGAGLRFVKRTGKKSIWNMFLFGYELKATRLQVKTKEEEEKISEFELKMVRLSIESDRMATFRIGALLIPFLIFYAVYELVYTPHSGWYSYLITTLSSFVYGIGFVFMTPQLFLNYKLKSVAHLPWKVLCYKFLNTFIDDLFAFIIRMPTMARLSCFRDDVVFFVYLGQRWMYAVDERRPVEGGGEGKVADEKEKKE